MDENYLVVNVLPFLVEINVIHGTDLTYKGISSNY